MPPDARDIFYLVESGCRPTLMELESMTQRSVELLIAYRTVKDVITYGGQLIL